MHEPAFGPSKSSKRVKKRSCSRRYFEGDQLKCQMFGDAFDVSKHFVTHHKGRYENGGATKKETQF